MSSGVTFEFQELNEFTKRLITIVLEDNPKKTKKFLNDEGFKLRKKVRECSKSEVKKDTGNYHKSWKKSKVYRKKTDDGYGVIVYNASRYAHIIEHGRRYKRKDGSETFVKGKRILERMAKEFEAEYLDDCDKLLDDIVKEIEA